MHSYSQKIPVDGHTKEKTIFYTNVETIWNTLVKLMDYYNQEPLNFHIIY